MAGMLSKEWETAEQKWWDWVTPARLYSTIADAASDSTKEEFFNDLVKRCVLVEPLSPTITTRILVAAIEQFAPVFAVKFLKSPLQVSIRIMAVVEMETPSKADYLVDLTQEYLFMIGGMPRSARAQLAKPVMFMDHPCKPRKLCEVVQRKPPEHMTVLSQASKLRASELQRAKDCLKGADYLRERQETEEWELHVRQEETFQALSSRYKQCKNSPYVKKMKEKYEEEQELEETKKNWREIVRRKPEEKKF